MQNTLRDAICFDDFWTAFGPRGFVAMAWWMGAQHASRIRREHGSYPLLQVTGHAGRGKSVLFEYLNKLQGCEHSKGYTPEHATCVGRARLIANLGRQVLVYEVKPESSSTFDWRELLQLYSGGTFLIRPPDGMPVQVPFRGALAISGNTSQISVLDNRLICVDLLGLHSSRQVWKSVKTLTELDAVRAECFALLTRQYELEMFDIFSRGAPAYTAALLSEYGDEINPLKARNFGQLMSLVDCLCLMLSLPNEQRVLVQGEVQDMLFFETTPF